MSIHSDYWQLGNNRGNKYSKKNLYKAPTKQSFWNFSMDQFAFHDIPDSIEYVLNTTHQQSLSYIGFSQGTAQAFAALSIHPNLNDKIDVFIALAPAMSPKGLTSRIVDSFVKASPNVLFLAFGRNAILGSTTMWQSILYPPIFVRVIDECLRFLFGWTGINIDSDQKLAAYPHLYSFTSVKSVVHWFQIIRNGIFQMYDDEAPNPLTSNTSKYYRVAKFPTRNIKTPIVLVYGGSDSLVDIKVMLKELPSHTVAKEIPHYEHLDFLWASSVDQLVFPHVFEALGEYAHGGQHDTRKESHFRSPLRQVPPRPLESGVNLSTEDEDESSSAPPAFRSRKASHSSRRLSTPEHTLHSSRRLSGSDHQHHSQSPQPQSLSAQYARLPYPPSSYAAAASEPPARRSSPGSTTFPPPAPKVPMHTKSTSLTLSTSTAPSHAENSKPAAWWSSDDVGGGRSGETTPLTADEESTLRPTNVDSPRSDGPIFFRADGIGVGTGKAVDGVAGHVVAGEGAGSGKAGAVAQVKARGKAKRKGNSERLLESI